MLKYRLRKIGRKKLIFWSTTTLIFLISIVSIVRYYAINTSNITTHASGISGDTVYVNDLTKDYNYYMGLNYTEITNAGSLPSGTNSNKYNDNNLLPVRIVYDGQDVNNPSRVGRVSHASGQTQSKFIYFKYYYIQNNKIVIDLIDNPFTSRPSTGSGNNLVGYGFNGWVCNPTESDEDLCDNASISYDDTYYRRYLTINLANLDYSGGLNIYLNAFWYNANITNIGTGEAVNTSVGDHFRVKSMADTDTQNQDVNAVYEVYTRHIRYTWKPGTNYYYNQNGGQAINTNNVTCNYPNTNYYVLSGNGNNRRLATANDFNQEEYFSWDQTSTKIGDKSAFAFNNTASLYYLDNHNHNGDGNYYSSAGKSCAQSGVDCGSKGYKLIQTTDSFSKNLFTTASTSAYNTVVDPENPQVGERRFLRCTTGGVNSDCIVNASGVTFSNFKYFVTRDINIVYLKANTNASAVNVNYPMTISSHPFNDGTAYTARTLTYGTITAGNDLVFENLLIGRSTGYNPSPPQAFYGNGYNTKMGRNVYSNASGQYNFTTYYASRNQNNSSSGSPDRYTAIVESGVYENIYTTYNATYTNVVAIIGSDYDRVNSSNPDAVNGGDNRKLRIFNRLYSTTAINNKRSDNVLNPFSTEYVLSGCIGCDTNFHFNDDNTAGAYLLSNQSNYNVLATSKLIVYGGYMKTIQGGAGYSADSVANAADIRVAGGTIGTIFGGARQFATYGNRITTVTGGNIIHNVFGGSNAYDGGAGTGDLDTLVYIGGTAHVGATSDVAYDDDDIVFSDIIGNVFGAGNGRRNSSAGSVNNSHVIINGGTIEGDVYGGGNYGGTGVDEDGASRTKIDYYDGTTNGSVFGGANNNGAGTSGTNTSGNACTCSEPPCVNGTFYVREGYVTRGGIVPAGKYYSRGTFDENNGGRVYYANNNYSCNNYESCTYFKEVNGSDSYNSNLKYYSLRTGFNYNLERAYPGTCTPSSATISSNYKHRITINKSGGTAKNVYGGSNESGTINGDTEINITGGTVTQDIFGGGLGTNTTVMGYTIVNVSGGTGRDVYGGSSLGRVNGTSTSNSVEALVNISGGTYGSIYGCGKGTTGNVNYPYTYGKSHVTITGGTMDYVYGGNNTSGTASHPTDVKLNGGIVNYAAFGGGNNVGHNTTNILLNGTEIKGVLVNGETQQGNIFGGSNNAGTVALSNVTIQSGKVRNVFGGNNNGGTTTESRVIYNSGQVSQDIFGGGNKASTGTTNVTINNGTLRDIYGGGNEAGVSTATNVLIKQGTFRDIYGGSNVAGTVRRSNVYISNGTMENVFGGNNVNDETQTAYVYIGNGTIHKEENGESVGGVYGGGNRTNSGDTYVHVYGGTMDGIYGGGSRAGADETNVYIYGGTTPWAFGGSNVSGDVRKTNVEIKDSIPTCTTSNPATGVVANPCYTRQTRDVLDVFGGGNNAPVMEETRVKMYTGTVRNLYGGGNKSFIGDATVVNGAFSTGVSGGEGDTYVYLANGTVTKNVYGSGNASFVYGHTHVYIGKDAVDYIGAANLPTNRAVDVKGNVFGGSETNATEDKVFDYKYKGVIGDSRVYVNGSGYNVNNFTIEKSIYGGGNNSTVGQPIGEDPGPSYIYISNYGNSSNPKALNSIQRGMYVYITDSVIELNGDRDRAELTMFTYGFVRVDNLYLLGSSGTNTTGSTLYMNAGNTYLSAYNSGTMGTTNTANYNAAHFSPQTVDIDNNSISIDKSNNKIYMLSQIIFAVTNEKAPSYKARGTDSGPVKGMTYLGMYYTRSDNSRVFGIYDQNLTASGYQSLSENQKKLCETNVALSECEPYTFVYGQHELAPDSQISTHGFYSHFETEHADGMYTDYVGVTPINANYYKWVLGKDVDIIDLSLQATKASVESAQAVTITLESLKEAIGEDMVDWHDATMTIDNIDTSKFLVKASDVHDTWPVKLVDRSRIPTVNENTSTTDNGTHTVSDANKYVALSMGTTSSSGWLERYNTNFYSKDNILGTDFCELSEDGCVGDQEYTYDSTTNPRALSFYMYYSKNLDFDIAKQEPDDEIVVINLGTVVINTTFVNPHGDPTLGTNVKTVDIQVNMALVDNKTPKYGTAINSGKHYSVFESSKPKISDDGVFSIYQMLSVSLKSPTDPNLTQNDWTVERIYNSDVYRFLTSETLLPVGTTITMLDIKNGEQYYYEVNATNRNAIIQSQCNNQANTCVDVQYKLEDFIRMGSTSPANRFDDDMNGSSSTKYYTPGPNGTGVAVEEFIFNIDFSKVASNVRLPADEYYMYLESKNATTGEPIMVPSGVPSTSMAYTIVNNIESNITASGGYLTDEGTKVSDISIYNTDEAVLELDTNLVTKVAGTNQVLNDVDDTKYNDYKLGAKIIIMQARLDGNGNPVIQNGEPVYDPVTTNLFGTVVKIGPRVYYPQSDGSIRVKLAGVMTNVISDIQFDFSNSDLEFGDYKMVVDTFASYDGLYEISGTTSTRNEFTFTLLNNEYGIDVSLPPVQVTRDVNTGKDKNDSLDLTFNLTTKNGLHAPNVKVHLERRKYNSNYDTTYEAVSLGGIADSMSIDGGGNILNSCYSNLGNGDCYIYNLKSNLNTNNAEETFEVKMTMKPGPSAADKANMAEAKWKSGTYRVVFTIYDGTTPIGSVYEYLIIRSLNVDEEVEGS